MSPIQTPRSEPSRHRLLVTLTCVIGLFFLAVACGEPQRIGSSSTVPATAHSEPLEGESVESETQGTVSTSTGILPTPANDQLQGSLPPAHYGAATASIEQRIYNADVVVRASLLSTKEGQLRFKAAEYLKGTGPTEFVVSVTTDGRNSAWDSREAVLFLLRPESGTAGASDESNTGVGSFFFLETAEESYRGDLPVGYTVDTRNPVWLPARLDGVTGTSVDGVFTRLFITGSGSAKSFLDQSISLADLRSRVAWIDGGENVKGYDRCIRAALNYYQWHRDWEAYYGSPSTALQEVRELESGGSQLIAIYTSELIREPGYHKIQLHGQDTDLFVAQKEDNDQSPSNGYRITIRTTRPLPGGVYKFSTQYQLYDEVPCNFKPEPGKEQLDWVVQAVAPKNSVFEAFFDPVVIGKAAGADTTKGVLIPASFSLDQSDNLVTLTKVTWESGRVTMEFMPSVSLQGYHTDFISRDGAVTLRLDFDDGEETVNGAKRTITWNVCKRPWASGELLMLRISKSGQSLTGVTNDGACKQNPD